MARWIIAAWLLTSFLAASSDMGAQRRAPQSGQEIVVGVRLQSNYARIRNLFPELGKRIAKAISEPRKHIRGVAMNSADQNVMLEARKSGCQFVLQLDVDERSGVGIQADLGDPNLHSTRETSTRR